MSLKNTNNNPDYFCIQPFVNVTTRLRGNHAVCCNIADPINSPNIKNYSINEFFNSEQVKIMREDLLSNKKLDICKTCHYMEDNNQTSHRQRYNEYWVGNNKDYEKIIEKLRLKQLKNPVYAEIHISNLCNLKCLTCNEIDSSKFHSENKELGISKNPTTDFTKFVIPSIVAVEQILTKDLRFLDIRGGETLMIPELKELLVNVPVELSKNVTLKIQTNGTINPDNTWLDIFKKFKNTKLNISIDAYDNDNHYVRYPSDWNKILKTIEIVKTNDIKFIINTVISNLNILVLDKLFDWIKKEQYLNYFYILKTPTYYQYFNFPLELLEESAKRLEKNKVRFYNKDMDDELQKLIYNCKNVKETNKYQWELFVKEIKMRDSYRKNDILKIIPELKEYINGN